MAVAGDAVLLEGPDWLISLLDSLLELPACGRQGGFDKDAYQDNQVVYQMICGEVSCLSTNDCHHRSCPVTGWQMQSGEEQDSKR